MVDFIKILVTDHYQINVIWNNPLLTYWEENKKLKKHTGEIVHQKIKFYKNIHFRKFDKKLEITGSVHYYFNDGEHNANTFSVIDCISTIYGLQKIFNLDLNKCKVINLEFGLNIELSFDVKKVIRGLLYQERNVFVVTKDLPFSKIASSINSAGRFNQYKVIKAYNKGIQFPDYCHIDTFRFEIKSRQSKYLNGLGV